MMRLSPMYSSAARCFSSSACASSSVPIALISKLRSVRPGTPLSLARSALQACDNDFDAALEYINKQAVESGAAKAAKLSTRTAKQGLIGVATLSDGRSRSAGVRAAMVELNCETDFVARTDEFRQMLESITTSIAFFAEPSSGNNHFQTHDIAQLAQLPLMPPTDSASSARSGSSAPTLSSEIANIVSRLGENISVSRAVSFAADPSKDGNFDLVSSFLHASKKSGPTFESGTIAALLRWKLDNGSKLADEDVQKLLRAVARQTVALPTTSVKESDEQSSSSAASEEAGPSIALYAQQVITLAPSESVPFDQGATVEQVLTNWRNKNQSHLRVEELARWELGVQ